MQLLRRPGFEDGETCQGKSVSASLTDLASRDPANFPQADPIFSLKCMAPVAARNAPAGTSGRERLRGATFRRFPTIPIEEPATMTGTASRTARRH
jgi:hypothetical protein